MSATTWQVSSHCDSMGPACVEVALGAAETSAAGGRVRVRDGKDRLRRGLALHPASWTSFVQATPSLTTPGTPPTATS
ncbi:DUF397 domain-containing protein [Streptomyces sp. NPDC058045]|uniref:DUF397 domain-containing protein n=1 Tax=Streptomyces sp. NPDC058045 TaxID=3346311 RepID=UPI0036F1482D